MRYFIFWEGRVRLEAWRPFSFTFLYIIPSFMEYLNHVADGTMWRTWKTQKWNDHFSQSANKWQKTQLTKVRSKTIISSAIQYYVIPSVECKAKETAKTRKMKGREKPLPGGGLQENRSNGWVEIIFGGHETSLRPAYHHFAFNWVTISRILLMRCRRCTFVTFSF